uniref:BZIP domain-containing protein n=1 Tax=Pyramimonas obovata TaxID=1411642 RepID=A0A7S0MQN8_9CHLO|mmetsp:Transcript_11137/g.23240  ORF Transcript_11137/g.23240 Transcript_11137/m.23240 type:complete len:254 (+) Transcript_11137:196-957(+)
MPTNNAQQQKRRGGNGAQRRTNSQPQALDNEFFTMGEDEDEKWEDEGLDDSMLVGTAPGGDGGANPGARNDRKGARPPATAALAALVAGAPLVGPDAAQAALLDPKRAKRILANRQSAARSKERKLRYISELERRVALLQSEATTLSTQYQILQSETETLEKEKLKLEKELEETEREVADRDALHASLQTQIASLKAMMGPGRGKGGPGGGESGIMDMDKAEKAMMHADETLNDSACSQQDNCNMMDSTSSAH